MSCYSFALKKTWTCNVSKLHLLKLLQHFESIMQISVGADNLVSRDIRLFFGRKILLENQQKLHY